MTPEAYLRQVLARHAPVSGALVIGGLRRALEPGLRRWGRGFIRAITVSGSNAKGTAVGGQTDIDFFISIAAEVPDTLSQIYWTLYKRAGDEGWNPRAQNVSIGVNLGGHKVDLVPGRIQAGYVNRHSLYRRKVDSWTVTDVSRHISLVSGSGRTEEIRLTKIWRVQRGLEFPSLALELAVLQATSGRPRGHIADNFLHVLSYLADSFESARLVDPSNSANVVSDDLTPAEKASIARAARVARAQSNWGSIIS